MIAALLLRTQLSKMRIVFHTHEQFSFIESQPGEHHMRTGEVMHFQQQCLEMRNRHLHFCEAGLVYIRYAGYELPWALRFYSIITKG